MSVERQLSKMTSSLPRLALLLVLSACAVLVASPRGPAQAAAPSTLTRQLDPVVFTGAQVPSLEGIAPGDLVAFRWDGGWEQIPVQVDERDVVDFGQVYNGGYGGVSEEQYTDPDTFTGPDSNPAIDHNDEIVFMAKDAGGKLDTESDPAGVMSFSRVEVRIDDPLDGGTGYVYLFRKAGGLDPGAGQQYVTYDFVLLSGDYKETYQRYGGPGGDHGPQVNAEDSLVTTSAYQRHWSWRWTNDGLRIFLGSGVDILEKRDYWIVPGNCSRHNATFNADEGVFFANISGPVRAIRSYMGANSGPLTQGEHIYYEQREDAIITARVHERSATGIFFSDYSADAYGMTYADSNNPSGVTIDGVPDTVTAGALDWDMVTGPQGSLVSLGMMETDIPDYLDGLTSYYRDEAGTSLRICQECEEAPTGACPAVGATNDAHLIGAHGAWGTGPLPNTDPRTPPYSNLKVTLVTYYDGPGLDAADAQLRRDWVDNPLVASFTATAPPVGGVADMPEVVERVELAGDTNASESSHPWPAAVFAIGATFLVLAGGTAWYARKGGASR